MRLTRLLLWNGADPALLNRQGLTVLQMAVKVGVEDEGISFILKDLSSSAPLDLLKAFAWSSLRSIVIA